MAAEFAFVAVDRDRVQRLAESGSRRARLALRVVRRLSYALSGIQLGITVTSLVLGFIAAPAFERLFGPLVRLVPDRAESPASIALALGLVSAIQMVIGELIPKGLAIAAPVPTALATAGPILAYNMVFGPVISVLNGAANWVVRRLGIEPSDDLRSIHSLEEIELLIRSSGREGTLDPESFSLLSATLRFGHKTAADALVPRPDVLALRSDATVADLVTLALSTGHSRFPVIGDDLDDVHGVVHASDALAIAGEDRASTGITSILRSAHFTPEGRDLEMLLTDLRSNGRHLAVVVDEFGGTAGIVTLEDLLEEIVGEIEDEHDQIDLLAGYTRFLPSGTFVVEGSLHLDEVDTATGLALPEGDYDTVAGFVLERLGRIPVVGEQVIHDGWTIEVMEVDRRRIASLRLVAPTGSAETPEGELP
ncbi:MAG: HlyC/CorC family transporter [Actinobacteria bacterium]|nr:HlyC/CorC family transporter [Actinomycetota bacterium]MBI3257020.1 HlyC/CorC family transporter [Actinomycetota bacterium]